MKRIDLFDLRQAALIIPSQTGVLYRQQCGGTACLQRILEGVLVPIGYDNLLENYEESFEYKLGSLFAECSPGVVTEEHVEQIQQMLDNLPFARGIKIDQRRLADSVESWLYVTMIGDLDGALLGFEDEGAVLTWPNSD
ncbi:MAG TPA: DUF6210 family protein [Gallionellaceae bacterium]